MLFCSKHSNYKEINRNDYYNDSDYYNEIINHICNTRLIKSKYNQEYISKIINNNNIYINGKNKKK